MFWNAHARVGSRGIGIAFAVVAALTFGFTSLTAQSSPTVALTAPVANATVSGVVTVSATASDSAGVAGVQFRLDGAPLGAEVLAAPYSLAWNTLGSASTDLVFGATKVVVGGITMTAGSGFTKRLSVSCPSCTGADLVSEDHVQTPAGPTAGTWTFSVAAHYLAQMAAFKATGTPAYVQGATASSNTASATVAKAFGAPVTAGNLLVVAVAWTGNSAIGVTDNRGNVYAVATSAFDPVNGQTLAILYAANAGSGATTVTASFSGTAPTVQRLEIHEYSGIAATSPLDVTATNIADGTTAANSITSGSAMTTGTAPVSNGSHTLTAVARDAAGNTTTSAAVTVTVNNGGGAPPVISGVAAASITASGATINWTTNTASDSQVDYGLTTAYGSASALNGSLATAHTVSLSGLAGSTLYHVRAQSRDAAGNLGLSGDVTFTTLDGTAPTVALTAPAANATVSGAVTVSATASDNVGVAGVQFRVDGAPLGAEVLAAPYSIAWNTLGSASTDLVFGATKVVVGGITMTAGSGFTKRLSVSCPSCTGADLVSEDHVQTPAGPTAGTWTFSIAAHYLAQMAAFKATGTPAYVQGATASSNTASTTVAKAFGAPVTAGNLIVAAVAWTGNTAVIATDNGGNAYSVATAAFDAVSGQSLAILYAANAASGATTVTVSFGGAAPTVQRLEIHEYSGIAATSPLDVTATNIADGTTAANSITSGSATTTGTALVSNGSHTLTAVARDAAGNTTTSAAVTVTVNNGGGAPPVISGVAAASITASGATINWTTNTASDSQVDYGLTTAYGSASALNGSLVTTHTVSLSGLTGSTLYHVRAQSRDAAGNLGLSGDVTFTTLDGTAPTVALTAPAANATVSGVVTVSATASDNVGVAGVQFRLDGAALGAEVVTAPYAVSWSTTTASNGSHTLTAVARDAAANQTTSAAVGVTVSNTTTPPVVSAVAVSAITVSGATISWTTNTASDSQVDYGLTTAYGSASALNGSLVTAHTVSLSGLTGSTLYHVRAQSRDAAGNLGLSGDVTFTTLDGTAPTVTLTAPAANATVSGVVTVSATASDNVGVAGVQFRLDGVALGAEVVTAPYAVSWSTTTASNGSHTLTAVARDAAANQTTSAAVGVTVSNTTTPPVVSAVAVSAITVAGATISWTTDTASDSQVDYGLTTAYGSASALNGSLVTAHTVSLSGLTGSTLYHVRAQSRDAAGNLGLSGDVTFTTLDGTAPTVALTAPAANATVSGSVTVSATASDNVGVAGVQFRLDGAPLGAEVLAAPYSLAWNTLGSASGDLVFGVTKVATGPPTMTAGSGFTTRLGVSCPGCTGPDTVSEDKFQASAGPTAATWTFSIAAHYLAQMAAFKAVGTPAFVQGATIASNSTSATTAQAFSGPVVTGHLLVVALAWQGTSPVGVTDNRGNVYAVATSAFDAVSGQTLAILYAANAASGATTVTASFSGTAPTIQRMEIHEYSGIAATNPLDVTATSIADGTTAANTITSGSATTTGTALVSNGSHVLTAQARDAAGNTTTSAAVTVTVNNGGGAPPVISGVAAVSITSSGATINWTTNTASDSQVDYGLTTAYGSTSPLIGTLVTTHSVMLGGLTGGTTYHVRARSKDAAGNLGLSGDVAFTTVVVDSTPPVVSITAPAANATVSGTVTFSATATDNTGGSGMAGVVFKLDGVNLAPEDTVAPYTVAWDTTTASAGAHTLTAVAWDVAGNQATATLAITVSNATAQVKLAWDIDTMTVAGYRVKVGTSSGVYSTANIDAGNVTAFTVTGLAPGNVYYLAVTAYDSSGVESAVSNEVSAAK